MAAEKSRTATRPEAELAPELREAVVEGIQNPDLVAIRRDQICDASLKLFLEKGFAATTIRDICAASGVNQASLYDYVANKHDILRRLLNKLWFRSDLPTLPERLTRDLARGAPLEPVIRDYLRLLWEAKRDGILLSYRSVPHLRDEDRRAMHEREKRMMHELAAILRRLTGLAPDDRRAEVAANLAVYMTAFGPQRDWLNKGVDEETILATVAAAMAGMIERLSRPDPVEEATETPSAAG